MRGAYPAFLQRDLPVFTLSNFWRETRRVKAEEEKGTLSNHLVIPELKNHRHIGGLIPLREFEAYYRFCREGGDLLSLTFMSGLEMLDIIGKTPGGFFSRAKADVVVASFEEKKDSPAAILTFVTPEIFQDYNEKKDSGALNSILKTMQMKPALYTSKHKKTLCVLFAVHANPDKGDLHIRIKPLQNPNSNGEKPLKMLSDNDHSAYQKILGVVRAENSAVVLGNRRFAVADVLTGRPAYAKDPKFPLAFQAAAVITMNSDPKRPLNSIDIELSQSKHVLDFLITLCPSVHLRANSTACTLAPR